MGILHDDRLKDMCWCVVPIPFSLLGVDHVNFAPLDDKFWKGYGVRDFIVLVPSNNRGYDEVPFD